MTRTITFTRRPKLAPLRIVLNRNQLEFLNEMKTEELRRLGRLERGRSILSPTITEEFQESAPPSSRAELRVEASPTPSVISVRGGPSRSSSRGTVRDGILVRYEGDNNNSMLRRPRTSSTDAGASSNRSSARMTKTRFNVVMRQQKVTKLVKALTGDRKPQVPEKTAAELSYEASKDLQQPFRDQKKQLLRQYYLWNGNDVAKMDLPPLPVEARPKSRAGDAWAVRDGAMRQLADNSHGPAATGHPLVTRSHQPVSSLTTKSSHVYSNHSKVNYLNKARKSGALEEYKRITAMEQLIRDTRPDDRDEKMASLSRPGSSMSTRAFCKTARPQTSIVRPSASPNKLLTRPASCAPRIRFQEPERSEKPVADAEQYIWPCTPELVSDNDKSSRASSAKSKVRSCWLSPLEMCNVPADAKLKYIVNTEKKRYATMMDYTARLLRNETIPLEWNDKIVRQLMAYKPKLDPDSDGETTEPEPTVEEIKQNSFDELIAFLDRYKNDPILLKISQEIAANVEARRVTLTDSETKNVSDDIKSCSVNPILIGSQTSKALVAGFYMLMNRS